MAFNLGLGNIASSAGGRRVSAGGVGITTSYGRVVEVILDEDHPKYGAKGGAISINGVFYKPISSVKDENTYEELPFAYQYSSHIKSVPLIGEIVKVEPQPVPSGNDVGGRTRKFYTNIINIWNNANNNFYPDLNNNKNIDLTQKKSFLELGNVNPIGSSPGDIQFEGRQGQSIRFTGGRSRSNPWVDVDNIGQPIIIISNGQRETEQGFITIGEDINEDNSSIYMVSNHSIPLKQANEKRKAYNEAPIAADVFRGNQVLINGGRLFLNAKTNDIQLSSVESIGMNTGGSINLDSTSFICLDGEQIFLGAKSREASSNFKEPVVLGNQLEGYLNSILNILSGMADDMAAAKTIKGHAIPRINKRGLQAKATIGALRRIINPNGPSQLKSKKVYTE